MLYGRVRLARFARVRLLRHASRISLLILTKKPTVLQSKRTVSLVIDAPFEDYSKLSGISKKQKYYSVHSVSCLINKALRISSCSMSSSK